MAGNLVETLIGAVVVAVAVVFLFFAYNKADVAKVDGYELTAKFEKVDGIKIGSDVMMAGIKVGTVIDQVLDAENFLAVVRFSLRDNIKLPDDSAIKVSSSGLLGDNFLSIDPGGSEDLLSPGDEMQYTQGAVDLIDLLGKAIYSSGDDN